MSGGIPAYFVTRVPGDAIQYKDPQCDIHHLVVASHATLFTGTRLFAHTRQQVGTLGQYLMSMCLKGTRVLVPSDF